MIVFVVMIMRKRSVMRFVMLYRMFIVIVELFLLCGIWVFVFGLVVVMLLVMVVVVDVLVKCVLFMVVMDFFWFVMVNNVL